MGTLSLPDTLDRWQQIQDNAGSIQLLIILRRKIWNSIKKLPAIAGSEFI
jgi:hypothetical protein